MRMVQFIHAVLRNALENAVREEIIPRNVAKLVRVGAPKYKVNRGLTVDQARAVLQAARGERLYVLYVLALCLGLRCGELLGLRRQDITLVPCRACDGEDGEIGGADCEVCAGNGVESGTLEVVQTLQRVGGALRFVRPKTEGSERTIPLPALCITALCEHRIRQQAERADAWPDWQDHGLVFPPRRHPHGAGQPSPELGAYPPRRWPGGGAFSRHEAHVCVPALHLGVAPDVVRQIAGHSDLSTLTRPWMRNGRRWGSWGCSQLKTLPSKTPRALWLRGVCAGGWVWAGAGSNRRPSAFQADARTN